MSQEKLVIQQQQGQSTSTSSSSWSSSSSTTTTPSKVIYMMGVSGCGKTTVGQKLASCLEGGMFLDGDDFHPPSNKQKMAKGIPLTDQDRYPWFDILKHTILQQKLTTTTTKSEDSSSGSGSNHHPQQQQATVIVACSALKVVYRNYLGDFDGLSSSSSPSPSQEDQLQQQQQQRQKPPPEVIFVYLKGSKEFIAKRLQSRVHEFMPSTLLDSQFETLEEPTTTTTTTTKEETDGQSAAAEAAEAAAGTEAVVNSGGRILVVPIHYDDGQPKSVDQIVTEIIEKEQRSAKGREIIEGERKVSR